jgi:hypothetical protein
MDINYILLLAIAIIVGLAYGLPGLFADFVKNGSKIDWAKLAATFVYSIIVGIFAVQTGVLTMDTLPNWQTLLTPVWTMYMGLYLFMLYLFSKIIVPVASHLSQVTKFFPKSTKVDSARKMDPESRKFLVFDLPTQNQAPTLGCVDQAEAIDPVTMRYAIQSGAWIFLVEFGELTGSKHYYFRGWFGTSDITWKPISVDCLEECRKTSRIPEYNDLY